ncbi:hypothetical protein ACF07B_07880 [Streptomyces sp. NPDC015532]|uniref:hypothetical protein n=1 Tax=Streptomyces sp. NPDC015532 TaxID=3364960 RepID=UPI0036FBA7FD
MRFIDEELLPNETSDAAAEAWKLREAIRPLVVRVRGLVERRLGPLTEHLEAASTHTLRCLSCGHFATILAAGPDGVGSLGSCLLCGKTYDSFTDALEAHGMGSRYEAVTQGGPPPAYECSECLADEDCVVLTQTADDPAGQVWLCLWGVHRLEGICGYCQRAVNFALGTDMCSDCYASELAQF